MSTKILGLVWPLQMPPAAKSVLVSLADQANDEGVCWPALNSIEERTCLDERTVRRALSLLQQCGAVRREFRSGHSTVYIIMPNEYRDKPDRCHPTPVTVTPPTPVTVTPPTPVTVTPHPGHCDPTAPVTVTPPKGSALCIEPSVEPSTIKPISYPSGTRPRADEPGDEDLFGSGESKEEKQKQKTKTENTKIPACPHLQILSAFSRELPELTQPKPALWNGSRSKALADRWRWVLTAKRIGGDKAGQRYATTEAEGIEFFRGLFAYVRGRPFLMGVNERAWKADLGWLLKAGNFAKVIEGNYENGR